MNIETHNIFENIPADLPEELVETLTEGGGVRIERIVSRGHCSPEGFWYDQDSDEWVIVLTGGAKLLFEGDESTVELKVGDYVHIPAHRKHRVEWTDQSVDTIWLAVHVER